VYGAPEYKNGDVPAAGKSAVAPSGSLYAQLWGETGTAEVGGKIRYQLNYQYGAGAKADMKLIDAHAQVTKAFSFALPESANGFSLLNEYYTGAAGVRNFLFYVHHFTANGGPEDQVHSIFVVNENGEIIRMLDGSSARVVAGGDTAKLMVFNDT